MEDKIVYEQWLQSLPDLAGRSARKILQVFPEPEKLFGTDGSTWDNLLSPGQKKVFLTGLEAVKNVDGMRVAYEKLVRSEVRFVSRWEKAFPEKLKEIPDAPLGLYYRGTLPGPYEPAVAIIGSRDCSEYGSFVAGELGKYLGKRGIHVISGMARGIDGISQQAALEEGGTSFGVLGCGIDICYPQSNRRLYEKLPHRGGLLSTYPPGTKPLSRYFPPRNRIVSGLADALVVVEARQKSGTLITVDMALEQGREVYVVPGRITDRLSDGCNKLLKQGANVFTDPESFLEELTSRQFLNRILPGKDTETEEKKQAKGIPEELLPIWKVLDHTPKSLDEIYEVTEGKYSISQLSIFLMRLVMEKGAKQVGSGYFCREV